LRRTRLLVEESRGAQSFAPAPGRERDSGELERRIDAVEIGSGVAEWQELLAATPVPARRCARGQAEVVEDLARHALVVVERDQAHRASAARALEHIEREHSLHQLRPVEPARAASLVGTVVARFVYDHRWCARPAGERMDRRALKRDPMLKSLKMNVHLDIGFSGSVMRVTFRDSVYAQAEIAQCLQRSIEHWNFPSADGEYEFEFPIVMQAN
jgi:hypothetical protein